MTALLKTDPLPLLNYLRFYCSNTLARNPPARHPPLESERAFVLENTSVPVAGSWGGCYFVWATQFRRFASQRRTAIRKSGAPELLPSSSAGVRLRTS